MPSRKLLYWSYKHQLRYSYCEVRGSWKGILNCRFSQQSVTIRFKPLCWNLKNSHFYIYSDNSESNSHVWTLSCWDLMPQEAQLKYCTYYFWLEHCNALTCNYMLWCQMDFTLNNNIVYKKLLNLTMNVQKVSWSHTILVHISFIFWWYVHVKNRWKAKCCNFQHKSAVYHTSWTC